MSKINELLKTKIKKSREKRINRIENNLERGKSKFILLYGILLWSPFWLLFWFLFIDFNLFNVLVHNKVSSINEILANPISYFLLRLPIAFFLGYINAVSHWHYLHRRLVVLKNKLREPNE